MERKAGGEGEGCLPLCLSAPSTVSRGFTPDGLQPEALHRRHSPGKFPHLEAACVLVWGSERGDSWKRDPCGQTLLAGLYDRCCRPQHSLV